MSEQTEATAGSTVSDALAENEMRVNATIDGAMGSLSWLGSGLISAVVVASLASSIGSPSSAEALIRASSAVGGLALTLLVFNGVLAYGSVPGATTRWSADWLRRRVTLLTVGATVFGASSYVLKWANGFLIPAFAASLAFILMRIGRHIWLERQSRHVSQTLPTVNPLAEPA